MSVAPSKLCDRASVLALNNLNAVETSELEDAQLAHLIEQSFAATAIGKTDAFLIALDDTADYDSPNFDWFRRRYDRFVYVDRIVVAEQARGRGHARVLYQDLFDAARSTGHRRVCCEVNLLPPNPGSDAFHAALGFTEVGRALLPNGKTVRYLIRDLI